MAPERELPRLSSAELVQLFGDDVAALQRYRMLAALLREGRPVGEVARTFNVSRESLRRLRHAYNQGSLVALRSRRRGGGHFARSSPLAQAIRDELAAEPGLPAQALWQRVEARMRAAGHPAPRSTFYRLLGRLRDEDAPPEARHSTRLIREALASLPEDPPITLGRSQLAELLLADERDSLQRGRRLAAALNAAIERLRPAVATPVLDDQHWRHYLIIAGEYKAGTERAELQETLALSTSTYTRAKREALERLRALLPDALDELPPTAPPPALAAPPPTEERYDREAELDQYMSVLRQSGLALIWSPDEEPAELAAILAGRLKSRGQHVVWHACRSHVEQHDPGLVLLHALGAALALVGRRDVWELGSDKTRTLPARWPALLAQALAGRHWTIVVANSHWLDGEIADGVIDTLNQARTRGDIRLVLAGQTLPAWADAARWPALPPTGNAGARRLFLSRLGRQVKRGPAPALSVLPAVLEAAEELTGLLPAHTALTPHQARQALEALGPVAALLERLQHEAREG